MIDAMVSSWNTRRDAPRHTPWVEPWASLFHDKRHGALQGVRDEMNHGVRHGSGLTMVNPWVVLLWQEATQRTRYPS